MATPGTGKLADQSRVRRRRRRSSSSSSSSGDLNAIDRQLEQAERAQQQDHRSELAANQAGEEGEDVREERENVTVMVRCRPLVSPKEGSRGCVQIGDDDDKQGNQTLDINGRQFKFDGLFGEKASNEFVYMRSARPLVEAAFGGYNSTIFLYGQTGTGKTYTHSSLTKSAFAHLFTLIQTSDTRLSFLIRASYYELYNEEIRDLLTSKSNNRKPLELRESKERGVYVKDLTCYLVNNLAELEALKTRGDKQRATAATKMNEHSSRSHSIFSITIETLTSSATNSATTSSEIIAKQNGQKSALLQQQPPVRLGRLYLVDLAGSERQSKSESSGVQLKEAARINLSLTCLSLVIRALTDPNSSHIPYRNSKLTRLLSSSLGGNSKTLLIACISPAQASLDETLNTLRFANRTKQIENTANINEDAKEALLRKYRRQIEELRKKLRERQQERQRSSSVSDEEAISQLLNKDQQQQHQQQVANNELLQQLRLLKGKIMVGGENLLEKAEMHEKLLEASKQELEEKKRQELFLKEKLELKQKDIERMNLSKGTSEGQVAYLDEKIKRALVLYKRTKDERRDMTSEHQYLKESLLQTIRATNKGISYADCIIEDFISREHLDLINTYADFDEPSGEWQIKYIALSGNNIAQTKRIAQSTSYQTNVASKDRATNHKQVYHPDPFIRLRDATK